MKEKKTVWKPMTTWPMDEVFIVALRSSNRKSVLWSTDMGYLTET